MNEAEQDEARRMLNTMDKASLNAYVLEKKYGKQELSQFLCHIRQIDMFLRDFERVMELADNESERRYISKQRTRLTEIEEMFTRIIKQQYKDS